MTTERAARDHPHGDRRDRPRRRHRPVRMLATTGAMALALLVAPAAAPADAAKGPKADKPHGGEFGGHIDEFDLQPSPPLGLGQVAALVEASSLHNKGITGAGVDVALVDTGVAPVPGLTSASAVTVGPDLSFDPQGADMPAGVDAFGHGTHMASIIARRGTKAAQGIAPGARILDMKVGAANGAVDVSQVIAAVNWVDQHRNDPGLNVRVLNLSYGTDGVQPYQIDPLAHAVETAWRHGIVVVVAAGNSGEALSNPAVDPYVLTVGAADTGDPASKGDDRTAAFSAVGRAERRVDVLAPGVSIVGSRVPGSTADMEHPDARVDATGMRGSGTSQAAAVVSGVVALLLQQRPNLTPDQVKEVLTRTASELSASPESTQGAGLIRAAKAGGEKPKGRPQAHPTSTGQGSLDAARGTFRLSDGEAELAGEVDVMSAPWDADAWATATTARTTWNGGTWNGNVWSGGSWEDGTTGAFAGRTWRGEEWASRIWRTGTWTGRTWRWH